MSITPPTPAEVAEARAARNGLVSDYGPLRIESATARVVSPWSPVAVHDEEER